MLRKLCFQSLYFHGVKPMVFGKIFGCYQQNQTHWFENYHKTRPQNNVINASCISSNMTKRPLCLPQKVYDYLLA